MWVLLRKVTVIVSNTRTDVLRRLGLLRWEIKLHSDTFENVAIHKIKLDALD